MNFILNLPSSPTATGFPFHRRSSASRGRGGSEFAGNARLASSARRSSIADSCPPLSRTGSKRRGSVEPKLSQSEAEGMVSGRQSSSRRFKWSKCRTKFLTNYLMQQASDGKGKDTLFKEDTLMSRYVTDHLKDSGLLNRPIPDYDKLSSIFGDDYDPSAAQIQLKRGQNAHSDDSKISEDPIEQNIANEDIRYLVLKIGELIDAVKCLKPRDFAEDLWKAVTACSYNERMSITAFEYFLKNEVEGKIFLVRSPDLRKEWLAKLFSSLM